MPKIIENLENRLLDEARKQIEASGYTRRIKIVISYGFPAAVA